MKVAYQDPWATLYTGTALDVLREMPSQSVHMAVCSPPYWGLRSYLPADHPDKGQELGTEKTPNEFVAKLVEVFGELWRVLRDDGTLWVNIGDSYSGGGGFSPDAPSNQNGSLSAKHHGTTPYKGRKPAPGLKQKDLCMVPARLAIALQSWGWYLRQELIWAKDSCMPESVKDRCTRSHEMLYMLTKRPTYFYDAEAIKESTSDLTHHTYPQPDKAARAGVTTNGTGASSLRLESNGTRNARSVWRINPKPYPGSHFAVFPPELPMRCIKAGTSEKGVCSECGAPWRRVVERPNPEDAPKRGENKIANESAKGRNGYMDFAGSKWQEWKNANPNRTVGWEPTCSCNGHFETHETEERRPLGALRDSEIEAGKWKPEKKTVRVYEPHVPLSEHPIEPAVVLDCFAGSGTTLYAARALGRKSVGIDLDEKSRELLEQRLGNQGVLL